MNNINKIIKKYPLECIALVGLLLVIARCLHTITGTFFPVYHKTKDWKYNFWFIMYSGIFLVYLILSIAIKNQILKGISILIVFGMAGTIVATLNHKDLTKPDFISVLLFFLGVIFVVFRQIYLNHKR